MDANAEQSDRDARAAADAAATAAQAEVARAAIAADAQAAENASLLAGILQATRESNDKIESLDRKFDTKFGTVSSSIDGLKDRADKTDERLKKQKDFFSGPSFLGEHNEESKSLILSTVVENKAELSAPVYYSSSPTEAN